MGHSEAPIRGPVFPDAPRGGSNPRLPTLSGRGAKGGKPGKVPRSTFLEEKGASKKVTFPFNSKRKGTF